MSRFFEKSQCVAGFLHDFKMVENTSALVDQCNRCKKKVYMRYSPFDGSTSKRFDQQTHLKEMIQPWHPLYKHEYKK